MPLYAKHISISINCPAKEVYRFASNPENLPKWAAGVSSTVRKAGDDWVTDSPMGEVRIKFAEENTFGILDHYVTLPDGLKFYNPMRVFPNDDGCEVVFTLYRQHNATDKQFDDDARMIETDLRKLKELMEG